MNEGYIQVSGKIIKIKNNLATVQRNNKELVYVDISLINAKVGDMLLMNCITELKAISTKKYTNFKKPVSQFDLKGNKINEFESIADAASSIGSYSLAIKKCCDGSQKNVKGYKFQYV